MLEGAVRIQTKLQKTGGLAYKGRFNGLDVKKLWEDNVWTAQVSNKT